ncbi:UNVERIFIED_CONTAM: hypothetical protein GTU68_061222 [Idotea baltica]|nr:hypothetical protein [Idotea baltica]
MIANRPDWCISRQRYWGVPIPLFLHKETGELHPETPSLIEQVALRIEQTGIQAWFDLDAKDLLGAQADEYSKVTDVLDVWFDSGTSFYHVLQQNEEMTYPADLYLEGSDQHRGWFHSSILASTAINKHAPYKQVLTHGFTVDKDGKKMSKSLKNTIAPQTLMKTLGADIVRLWVCSVDYRGEMSVSQEILDRMADSYRRIRNTSRYLLSAINDFDPAKDAIAKEDMLAIDRWAIDRTLQTQTAVQQAYENYQFHAVYQAVHNFCNVDMSNFYLDIIKDRQYTMQADSLGRRSAQSAMYLITEALVRWITPVLSFTSDEIWQHMPGDRTSSVFTQTYFDGLYAMDDNAVLGNKAWDSVVETRNAVTKALEVLRADKQIGGGLDAAITLYCDGDLANTLSQLDDELRFVFITSEANAVVSVQESQLAIGAVKLEAEKCVRCWHKRDDIGTNAEHPELCARCATNAFGDGEQRQFA